MNLGTVFTTGIKENFRSKGKMIGIIVIAILPLLYSFFYLKAFWDPYKNLPNMPVAIVNEDRGDNGINYGDNLIKELHNSTDVKWNFVDRETADAGLRDKTYYAEFLIPADFSEMIKSGKPGAATIELYANSKNNFMATLLASQVEKRIEESISQQISERTVQAMLQSIIQRQGESPYVSALDEAYQRRIINLLINSVYVYDDKVVMYFNLKGSEKQVSYIEMCNDMEGLAPLDKTPIDKAGTNGYNKGNAQGKGVRISHNPPRS